MKQSIVLAIITGMFILITFVGCILSAISIFAA